MGRWVSRLGQGVGRWVRIGFVLSFYFSEVTTV